MIIDWENLETRQRLDAKYMFDTLYICRLLLPCIFTRNPAIPTLPETYFINISSPLQYFLNLKAFFLCKPHINFRRRPNSINLVHGWQRIVISYCVSYENGKIRFFFKQIFVDFRRHNNNYNNNNNNNDNNWNKH